LKMRKWASGDHQSSLSFLLFTQGQSLHIIHVEFNKKLTIFIIQALYISSNSVVTNIFYQAR
jgi:hypothetical protein